MVNSAITHSQGVSGVGATTGGTEVSIGTITLPRPGPWNIWGLWWTHASALPGTGIQLQSFIRVNDINADLTPTPTPYTFPTYSQGAVLGDGGNFVNSDWRYKPVRWSAAGGAQIQFLADEASTVTTGSQFAVGIFYGVKPTMYDVVAQDVIANHIEAVAGTADTTAETSAGTITLSEKAKQITGLCVDVVMGTGVEGEEVSGMARIQSDDVDLPPFTFPFSHVMGAGLDPAEAHMEGVGTVPKFIPVHIPVPAGVAIEFLTDLVSDVGAAAITRCYIAYL